MARWGTYRRRYRRKAFSNKQMDVIKKVAAGTPETNDHTTNIQTGPGTVSGNSYLPAGPVIAGLIPNPLPTLRGRYIMNLFSNIPRIPYASLPPDTEMVGDKITSVGVSVKGVVSVFGTRNWRVRCTVVSSSSRTWSDPSSPQSISDTDYEWLNRESFTLPTYGGWNPNNVRVLGSVTREFRIDQTTGTTHTFKMWVPITGTKTLEYQPNVAVEPATDALAGRNYYLFIEWHSPSNVTTSYTPTANDAIQMSLVTKLYWKEL